MSEPRWHMPTYRDGDITIVAPEGRLDASNLEVFSTGLEAAAAAGPTRLIVDLAGVVHITSSAWGTMIACRNGLVKDRRRFLLCGLKGSARTAYDLLSLHQVLDARPTRAEALVDK